MKTTILPLAVVFVAVATMAAAQESKERLPENRFDMVKADGSSLTAIQEHHNRRMDKLKELIEERRRLVKAHESGERRLSGEDFDMVARQLRNFQRKLEHLDQTNDVLSHKERLEEMRSLHDEHRLDFVQIKSSLRDNSN